MAGQRKTPRKKQPSAAVKAKWLRCLLLKQAGASYGVIAQDVGYSSAASAYNAVQSALDIQMYEPAEALRKIEQDRLDRMQMGLWERAVTGHGPSVDRVLRIMERRARLLNLDQVAEGDDGQLLDLVEALAELRRKAS